MSTMLLIQPPVMKRIEQEDEEISKYFDTIDSEDEYLGDSPFEPNLGLLSIAGVIRQYIEEHEDREGNPLSDSYSIKVLDFNIIERNIRKKENRKISEDDIKEELRRYEYTAIIGLSFMTSSYGIWGTKLIEICKQEGMFNSIPLVFLGGIHPSVQYKEIYNELEPMLTDEKMIDGIVVGEGELIFREIFNIIVQIPGPENRNDRIAQLPSVYTGDDRKEIHRARLTTEELSKLPIPAYDLLVPNDIPLSIRLYTERGCTNNCTFCSVSSFHNNDQLRGKVSYDIEKVFDNLEEMLKTITPSCLVIGDLSFLNEQQESTIFLKKLIALQRKLKEDNKNLKIWCQSRADLITKEKVNLLKKAGCEQIAIGCEGATKAQLDGIKKHVQINQVENALKIIRNAKIKTQTYWVIGLPYDTAETVKETQNKILDYIEKGYSTNPHITVLVPYPNTPIALTNSNGIKINSRKWEDYWMNCDPFGCGVPVYETTDSKGNTLLSSKRIYTLWKETLQMVKEKIEERNRQTPQQDKMIKFLQRKNSGLNRRK